MSDEDTLQEYLRQSRYKDQLKGLELGSSRFNAKSHDHLIYAQVRMSAVDSAQGLNDPTRALEQRPFINPLTHRG